MENWQKGEIAELKVILRAIEKGLVVCKPLIPSTRYDLILDDGAKLMKVQIKWAGSSHKQCSGSVVADLRKMGVSRAYRHYTSENFDLLLVYVSNIDKICAFGPEIYLTRQAVTIRYEISRNGQTKNCIMADQYVW